MEQIDLLATATTEFARRIAAIGDDQWDLPTPCEGWTVTQLVSHLVGGNRMAVMMLEGASRDEALAMLAGLPLGDDPLTTFTQGAEQQLAAFREEGALERICHHPAGDFPGEVVLGFRIGDLSLHAWDLARAVGADEILPDELVAAVWENMQPMVPIIAEIGIFGSGPSGTVAEDEDLQLRLLDLTGRRP